MELAMSQSEKGVWDVDHEEEQKGLFLICLEASLGNVKEACEIAGIGRTQFYHWRRTDKEFKQATLDVKEGLIDLAEQKLMEKVEEGVMDAIKFFLKCQGKDRGWVERKEISGAGGGPIKIVRELPKEQLEALKDAARHGARRIVQDLYKDGEPKLLEDGSG